MNRQTFLKVPPHANEQPEMCGDHGYRCVRGGVLLWFMYLEHARSTPVLMNRRGIGIPKRSSGILGCDMERRSGSIFEKRASLGVGFVAFHCPRLSRVLGSAIKPERGCTGRRSPAGVGPMHFFHEDLLFQGHGVRYHVGIDGLELCRDSAIERIAYIPSWIWHRIEVRTDQRQQVNSSRENGELGIGHSHWNKGGHKTRMKDSRLMPVVANTTNSAG